MLPGKLQKVYIFIVDTWVGEKTIDRKNVPATGNMYLQVQLPYWWNDMESIKLREVSFIRVSFRKMIMISVQAYALDFIDTFQNLFDTFI